MPSGLWFTLSKTAVSFVIAGGFSFMEGAAAAGFQETGRMEGRAVKQGNHGAGRLPAVGPDAGPEQQAGLP
ncbi:hypothetical protein [Chitinophaga rhizosphaerae]|uniref:hypothetical protein n=1 Tax=Chitinophaga rhizosphaerae TaxID=1864947 RepID=UPI000F81512E|nr:hypothetical protein [Chitinophaga rhizosphaerae]